MDINFKLRHGILKHFEVDGIFVWTFGVVDDAIGDDGAWEVVIDESAVDGSFAQILYFDVLGDVGEDGVDPGGDGLPGDGGLMDAGFVHKNYIFVYQLPY